MPRERIERHRSVPATTPMEPGRPAGILALQRTAGNHAVTQAIGRKVVDDAQGTVTGIRFTVGNELTAAFAQEAKHQADAGRIDIERLRTTALSSEESVDDNERMFIAALLDARNVAALKRTPFQRLPDSIEFPEGSITAAARAKVADLDRPKLPKAVGEEERARDHAAKVNDGAGWAKHVQKLDKAATAEVLRLAGTAFGASAHATLALAFHVALGAEQVLRAMIAAGSDSTPGDMTLAGAVFVIAHISGSPLEADLLAGRLKVDEVPQSTFKRGEWAAYQPLGNERKGDTIYLPTQFDPGNLGHQSAVVHELQHAEDDRAAGPSLTRVTRDQLELRAYRRQARFLLDTIEPLTGTDRTTAISDAASEWQQIIALAMALEARADVARFGPILGAVNRAAVAGALPARTVTRALNDPVTQVEAAALQLIQVGYGMTATSRSLQDGLSGESILDWVKKPMPPP
jgi:hypothetical protein